MSDDERTLPFILISRPRNGSDDFTCELPGNHTITGISEKVEFGIDRFGKAFISVVRGTDDEISSAGIANVLDQEKILAHRSYGTTRPHEFKKLRGTLGYRRYVLYSNGMIEVDGGRGGNSIVTHTSVRGMSAIPLEDVEELLVALQANRELIVDAMKTLVKNGHSSREKMIEIASIPSAFVRQLRNNDYVEIAPPEGAEKVVDLSFDIPGRGLR